MQKKKGALTTELIKHKNCEIDDRTFEIPWSEENNNKKEWQKKNEESLPDPWDTIKRENVHVIGIPKDQEKGVESLFKDKMGENIPI